MKKIKFLLEEKKIILEEVFIFFENKKISKLSNIKIANLNGFHQNQIDLSLLGSINFYKSDAIINDIEFENINSEDAINSYRANIKINNGSFNKILSDAIDIDFGSGNCPTSPSTIFKMTLLMFLEV